MAGGTDKKSTKAKVAQQVFAKLGHLGVIIQSRTILHKIGIAVRHEENSTAYSALN